MIIEKERCTGSTGIGQLTKNIDYIPIFSFCPNPSIPPELALSSSSYSQEYEKKGR